MLWVKLEAGALQLTLFIAVIIALLLTGFVMLVHTHKQFSVQNDFSIQTTKNNDQGINATLMQNVTLNDTVNVELYDEDYKHLKVYRTYWGIFEKVVSISEIKKNKLKKVALIGGVQPELNRTALYLEDHNKPLVLVGNTKIEGVAYLSRKGVKSGTISGESYYGSQHIYGIIKTASEFPEIHNETLNQLETINHQFNSIPEEQFLTVEYGKTYINSFFNPIQVVFSKKEIQLNNNNLTGNIIIKSHSKIVIDTTSKLKDVVLIAPEIEIKNNVRGTFQAIATKAIYVGKHCKLNYPSALVINKGLTSQQLTDNTGIIINNNTSIKGVVLHFNATKTNTYKPEVIINEDAEVIGEVYCKGNFELRGSVLGSVFTTHIVASQSGSIYQNHIYNGVITIKKLSQQYIGLPFKNTKKGIIKWLY